MSNYGIYVPGHGQAFPIEIRHYQPGAGEVLWKKLNAATEDEEPTGAYNAFLSQAQLQRARQRITSGPYKATGDTGISGQANTPNQAALLQRCSTRFNTSAMRGIWTGNHYSTTDVNFINPSTTSTTKGKETPWGAEMYEISAAAEWALYIESTDLMDACIEKLLLQVNQLYVQFRDPAEFPADPYAVWPKGNIVGNTPYFEIAEVVHYVFHLYQTLMERMAARGMATEKSNILDWFDRAGAFFSGVRINVDNSFTILTGANGGVLQNDFDLFFSNARAIREANGDIEDLIWTGGSGTGGNNTRSLSQKTHQFNPESLLSNPYYDPDSGGCATTTLHRRINNRVGEQAHAILLCGIALRQSGVAAYQARATYYINYWKYWYRISLAFGVGFRGQFAEFERTESNNPTKGLTYTAITLGMNLQGARMLWTMFGDTECLDYETYLGAFEFINGSQINGLGLGSVKKSYDWMLVEFKKHMDGTYIRYGKSGSYGVAANRIRGDFSSNYVVVHATMAACVSDYYTQKGSPYAEQIRLMYRHGPGSGLYNYPVDYLPGDTKPTGAAVRGTMGGDVPWHWPSKMGSVLLAYAF